MGSLNKLDKGTDKVQTRYSKGIRQGTVKLSKELREKEFQNFV